MSASELNSKKWSLNRFSVDLKGMLEPSRRRYFVEYFSITGSERKSYCLLFSNKSSPKGAKNKSVRGEIEFINLIEPFNSRD